MTLGTGSALTTPARSSGDHKPVWLVRIATGLTSPTVLRYHSASQVEALTWDGESYAARPFDPPEVRREDGTETQSMTLRIADPDGTIFGYALSRGLYNQRARAYYTDRAVIDAGGSAAIRADFKVEGVTAEEGVVVLTLQPLTGAFGIEVPRKRITRAEFPGLPRIPR